MCLTHPPIALYQPPSLDAYQAWLLAGFSGKPFSLGGPDTPSNPRATVVANRQQLWQHLQDAAGDRAIGPWVIPKQVHGALVIGPDVFHDTQDPHCEADGLWLTQPGQAGMILTADCVPVMVIAPTLKQVMVIHAGWRGTEAQIVRHAITRLLYAHPECPPESLHVLIGPCIQPCCFQVSREVAEALAGTHGVSLHDSGSWIHWDTEFPDNPRVSLPELNRQQCASQAVTHIEQTSLCTQCQTDSLFSYRAGDDGRQGCWAVLLP